MESIQPTVTSTVQLPLSPPLMECMNIPKGVRTKMNTYNNSNGNYHDAITEDYNKIGSGSNSILKYLMIIKALTKLLKNETIGRKQAYRFLESEGFKGEYYEYLRKGVVNG